MHGKGWHSCLFLEQNVRHLDTENDFLTLYQICFVFGWISLFHPRATWNLKMNCHGEENLIYHTLDFLLKGTHMSVPIATPLRTALAIT